MDNPIDPSRLLNAKVTEKAYDDAVSPAAREAGCLGEDLVKAFRLFTAPIQLLANWQDRFRMWLDNVRSRVPAGRQVEAPAYIAGPVLLNLRFIEDDNILRRLYMELLTRAIDSEGQHLVHPAFVKILEQMAQEEALLLYHLRNQGGRVSASERDPADSHDWCENRLLDVLPRLSCFPGGLRGLYQHINHLELLGLIEHSDTGESYDDGQGTCYTDYALYLGLTAFGQRFVDVCVPEYIGEADDLPMGDKHCTPGPPRRNEAR